MRNRSVAGQPVTKTDQDAGVPEPCPPALSTVEVFESFAAEGDAWEFEGPFGAIRGHTLGEGPAIYFLNGLEGTSELFRLLAWLLRDDFRCVLYDPPAADVAEKRTGDPFELPDLRQLWAVADWHGDDAFHLYGSGFGGWLALAAMLSRPERIQGAILQAGYATRRFKLLEKLLLSWAKRSSRTFRDVPAWRAVFEQNHRRWFPPFDAARFEIFAEIAGGTRVQNLSRRLGQLKRFPIERRLNEISQPVLLLNTEGEGKLLGRQREFLETALPDVRSEVLKNSGLVPHWTHPHRVAKLIREFLISADVEQTAQAAN